MTGLCWMQWRPGIVCLARPGSWLAARGAAAGLLLLLVPLTTGCSTGFIRGHAERRIQHRLVDLIGPAEEYKVRVRHTKDAEIVVGRIRRIEIDGRHIKAGGQLELESLHVVLQNLKYHAPPAERLTVDESQLESDITEAALNDYLRRQNPDLQPEVVLNDGTLILK